MSTGREIVDMRQGADGTWGAVGIWDARETEIIRQINPDANRGELELFSEVCEKMGLDPFSKQIYLIKRKGKMTIQTGIDGFRVIAQRSNDYIPGPTFWCGPDGKWVDVWLSADHPAAAKVGVKRAGWPDWVFSVARWDSYVQLFDGKPGQMWAKMPDVMIAKCAESLALRKAFPQELSGLYTSEEMQQADNKDIPGFSMGEHKPAPAASLPDGSTLNQSQSSRSKPASLPAGDPILEPEFDTAAIEAPVFEPFPNTLYEDGDVLSDKYMKRLLKLADAYIRAGGSPRDYIPLVREQTGGKIGFGHLTEEAATIVGRWLNDETAKLKGNG